MSKGKAQGRTKRFSFCGLAEKVMAQTERLKRAMAWLLAPEQRPSALLTIFLALLALFLSFLRSTPEGQRWLTAWQARRAEALTRQRFQEALFYDPPFGFRLEQAGIPMELANPTSRPALIVVFGSCEGCGEGLVREWVSTLSWQTWQKEVKGVLVFQEKAEKVREAARKGGWQVKAVADEKGQIARTLNAFFIPRAYGFVDGKLVWLQKEPKIGVVSVLGDFLKVAKGEEKAKALLNAWSAEMREKVWGKTAANAINGRGKP